jgi:hypothetical protein
MSAGSGDAYADNYGQPSYTSWAGNSVLVDLNDLPSGQGNSGVAIFLGGNVVNSLAYQLGGNNYFQGGSWPAANVPETRPHPPTNAGLSATATYLQRLNNANITG